MVSRYKDQGLIRMFLVELHCFSNCIIHGHGICDRCCCIICMAGPVDLSALNHHEEAGLIVQYLNSFFNIVGKSPFAFFAVHVIAHCIAVRKRFIDNDCFSILCGQALCLCLGFDHFIPCFFCQLVQIRFIPICSGCLLQTAACKIIKITCDQLLTDFIITISGCLMCIESCRCCMI